MAGRGPLPNPNRRRRNAPTIPTTSLPAGGRKGRAPSCPYSLEKAGRTWWQWAWKLPQAAAWDDGALYALARRAQLEDDLVVLDAAEEFDLAELLGVDSFEMARQVDYLVRKLKGLAGGRVAVMREMRELDSRFGLTPKALADLRWTIVASEQPAEPKTPPTPVRRLRAVDPRAAAG